MEKTKPMYYDDHLAAAEKEESSRNFCNLVDVSALLYDEEEEGRKLKSNCHTKTEALSEKEEDNGKRIYSLFPRKTRSVLKKLAPPQNHENPNGASTSSPLLDLNTIPSETEAPSNPLQGIPLTPSPSFPSSIKTERTSRKKSAVQERERGKFKKATVPTYSWKERATPEWLVELMKSMEEAEGELVTQGPWLIFEKKLTRTDVRTGQGRLLMPFNSLIRNDFLTAVEELGAVEKEGEENGVKARLVDQRNEKWDLRLKRWEMMKGSGNGTLNYALISGWSDVIKSCGLKADDDISVWYFRLRGRLCFALVRPPPDMAQSSSSLAVCA